MIVAEIEDCFRCRIRCIISGDVADPRASQAILEFTRRMTDANPFIEVIDATRRTEIQELVRAVMQDPGHVEIIQDMIAGAGQVRAGITAASPYHARAAFFRVLLAVRHIRMVVQAAVAGRATPNINGLHQADLATAEDMKQSPEGLKGFLASVAPSPLTVLVIGRRGLMATQHVQAPVAPIVAPVVAVAPVAAHAVVAPGTARVVCQYCGKTNHTAAACNVRKRDEAVAQGGRGRGANAQPPAPAPPRPAAPGAPLDQTATMLAMLRDLLEKK